MADNKILNYSFAYAGKNKYYASDVDEYLKSISESYDTMSKNYRALDKKMKSLAPVLEEYKANKNTIVAAIVRAEKVAETVKEEANGYSAEILRKASEEAENYLLTKKAEADAYYYNLTHEADDRLKALEAEVEATEKRAAHLQEKYLAQTNEAAAEIIENAKLKAAEIVAAAYQDAKTAREQSDEIIAATSAELKRLKGEIAKYKNEIFNVVATIKPAVDSITADAEFSFIPTEVEVDTDKFSQEIPAFSLDMELDEPSVFPSSDLYEDISSFTEPFVNPFVEDIVNTFAEPAVDTVKASEPDEAEDTPDVFSGLKGAIFADDEADETPIDFVYHSDLDDLFESEE